jgi:hypothetical protein
LVSGNNGLLSLAAAVGSLALLAAVIFMLWPADPSETATASQDQPDGEAIGWVSKVEANTIHVSSGPFGDGAMPLLVTKNTRITVGSKEGWFEDIRPGGQVKVVYQVAQGRRLARTVELLVDEGPRRPVRAEPRVKSTAGGAAAEHLPTKAAVATSPAPPEAKGLDALPVKPPPAVPARPGLPAPPEVRPAVKPEPARAQATEPAVPRPSAAKGRGTAPAESGGRVPDPARPQAAAQPAPGAGRPGEAPRSSEGESADGAAAVDWLLNSRR